MYGCSGAVEDRLAAAPLDDPAGVHHGDLVGRLGDHAEVVRDQDDGRAELALELRDQLEDLRLDGDVERRRRLVRDQDSGSRTSAIAIITRWRMPPESSCG